MKEEMIVLISHKQARLLATDIVSKMTISEKIDQINFRAPAIPRLNIPEYNYWNEGLHGVARAGVATVFPQAIALAATFSESLLYEVAEAISIEGRAKYNEFSSSNDRDIYKGLTYWSPNLNLFRDPRWGRGQETYGEDPLLVSRLGESFIRGLQGNGDYLRLAACAKHFAVHSGPEADRHFFNAEVSLKDLTEFYLPAFECAVRKADVEGVMGSYNAINGIPACVNHWLLQELLCDDWGFEGYVVSDYAALEDVYQNHKYLDTASETMALALKTGCHLCAGEISSALFESLSRGLLEERNIDEAVTALYATRIRLGMFDKNCEYNSISYEKNDSKEHQNINYRVAQRTMVLLKNTNILPLKKDDFKNIAVIGPNAVNPLSLRGNYFGTPSKQYTFLEGIQDELEDSDIRVYYALGSHHFKDHAESGLSKPHERETEAVIAAKYSDISILCLGLDPTMEGEQGDAGNIYASGDRETLSLPKSQERLLNRVLEVGKPVIVVLSSGSSLSLNGLENHPQIKAIIQAWYPGSFGGKVLADILFGKISPSGKLPVTFYKDVENLPEFNDYSMSERTYQNVISNVTYPFGYGLNYGNGQIVDFKVIVSDNIQINVVVDNLSNYFVEEVLQVYIKISDSEFAPKNWKLIGFKRVKLTRKKNQVIQINIDKSWLKVVNEKGRKIFDGSQVTFFVGFSQPDILSQKLTGQKVLQKELDLSTIIN